MMVSWDIEFLYKAFLIFMRLGALLFLIPAFNAQGVPTQVRAAFALLFAYLLALILPERPELPGHFLELIIAGIKEILTGALMGLVVRIAFQVASLAGEVIDSQGGFSRDSYFDPFVGGAAGPTSRILGQFAVVGFLTTGMHLLVFGAFVKSFEIVSLGGWVPAEGNVLLLVAKSAGMIGLAIQIAAPFIAFNFIINMSFAVLGKAAPQMNVMVVSFAVLIVGGLLLLLFSMPLVAQLILQAIGESARNMLSVLQM